MTEQQDILSLERLNRLYSMLSRINRVIVRAQSPSEIYTAASRIAVEECNFRFTVIALIAPEQSELIPVATAGSPFSLQWLPLFSDDDVGHAADETRGILHEPLIINDIQNDALAVWGRRFLEEAGVASLAIYPLRSNAAVFGIMAVGSSEAQAFNHLELHLLEEVADDISFATDVLHRDEERLANEAKIHYLAYYDVHTGLPGRLLLEQRLSMISEQDRLASIAVMAIKLRNYHDILQVLGQNAGIAIARTVTSRIETLFPTAITARISEAEFVLALENHKKMDEEEKIAWRIHHIIAEPIIVDKQEIFLDAFIGIAIYPQDGGPAEVVKAALTATDKASLSNGSCYRFFVSGMDVTSRKRLSLDTALRQAISRQEFELYYQPQVNLDNGRIVGAEALLRWRRPDSGLVQPVDFIALLEETGLISVVGEWVVFEACAACRRWQDSGLLPIRVAVNLSGRQFRESDINGIVRSALHGTHLDPHKLELEVTESIILPNASRIIRMLQDLKTIGVNQALDDFGTGYSSLSYLQRLPVQHLKIDRSFVANITSNPNDTAIVRAVISMAHSLGITVIAEGVETKGQLAYLNDLACDEMQGFFFSPPRSEFEFVKLLRADHRIKVRTSHPRTERVVLLVASDPVVLSTIHRILMHSGIRILSTTNPGQCFEMLSSSAAGVIICEQRMQEMTGTELLRRVKALHPTTVRIVLADYADLNSVFDAVNRGNVHKFLAKPLQDDLLIECIEDAFHLHEMEYENQTINRQLQNRVTLERNRQRGDVLP